MVELKHQNPGFKPQEIVGTATHSSRYSVIVEGVNDVAWYREIEGKSLGGVFFTAVGGRSNVLKCYEYAIRLGVKGVVFVVDKDLWAIYGVPSAYNDVVTTSGYSIENDVLKDSPVHRLFNPDDRRQIAECAHLLARWFAFHAETYKNRTEDDLAHKYPGVWNVIKKEGESYSFNEETLRRLNYVEPPKDIVTFIHEEFEMRFRGKSLLELYLKFLKSYNSKNLMEMSIKIWTTETQKSLVNRIRAAFQKQGISL